MNAHSMRAVMVVPICKPASPSSCRAFAPALAEIEQMSGHIRLDPLFESAPIAIRLHEMDDEFADLGVVPVAPGPRGASFDRTCGQGRDRTFCDHDVLQ
jgi:hypothetical protein